MSSHPQDDVMSSAKAAHSSSTYWVDRVSHELLPLLQMMPEMTFDSPSTIISLNEMMRVTGPTAPGVNVQEVGGIGAYYFSSVEDDEVSTNSSSAVLWVHGGGRIMGHHNGAGESVICSRIVKLLGVPVLSVEYRLAPEHPFPAALDDIRKAYLWLVDHLDSERASSSAGGVRIAVAGESAGAGFAAELCQRLLDESRERNATTKNDDEPSVPLPVCQLLIYPMLDDRTCVNDAFSKLPSHLIWNIKSNMYAWSSYLGPNHKPGDAALPDYASASRRKDLSGLPPAHVQVGDVDLFHKECAEYAKRLKDDGVETDFVEVKGGFHGYLALGKDEERIVKAWEEFQAFGRTFLIDWASSTLMEKNGVCDR